MMFDYESKSTISWGERIGFLLTVIGGMILFGIFIYWLQNPSLTHMQVFIKALPFEFAAMILILVGGIIRQHSSED